MAQRLQLPRNFTVEEASSLPSKNPDAANEGATDRKLTHRVAEGISAVSQVVRRGYHRFYEKYGPSQITNEENDMAFRETIGDLQAGQSDKEICYDRIARPEYQAYALDALLAQIQEEIIIFAGRLEAENPYVQGLTKPKPLLLDSAMLAQLYQFLLRKNEVKIIMLVRGGIRDNFLTRNPAFAELMDRAGSDLYVEAGQSLSPRNLECLIGDRKGYNVSLKTGPTWTSFNNPAYAEGLADKVQHRINAPTSYRPGGLLRGELPTLP